METETPVSSELNAQSLKGGTETEKTSSEEGIVASTIQDNISKPTAASKKVVPKRSFKKGKKRKPKIRDVTAPRQPLTGKKYTNKVCK